MISQKNDTQMPDLGLQRADHTSALARAIVGAAPAIGSALVELVGYIAPNQRVDRLVDFATKLNEKTKKIEQSVILSKLTDENFVDILEEGMIQAARSVSENRREYITSIIANGISQEQIQFIETRRLLKLLSELNDNEIIILRFYLVPTVGGDIVFRDKHKNVLNVERAVINSPQQVIDKEALHNSYLENLVTHLLLRKEISVDVTNKIEFDTVTMAPKVRAVTITPLGKLFLRQLGLVQDVEV